MTRWQRTKLGSLFLILEGLIFIGSTFVKWTEEFSAYNLFRLASVYDLRLIFIFPIFAGVILMLGGIVTWVYSKYSQIKQVLLLIGVIIALNLELFFLTEIFNSHGSFIWRYPGLYVNLIGLGSLMITISLNLFQQNPAMKNSKFQLNSDGNIRNAAELETEDLPNESNSNSSEKRIIDAEFDKDE